MMNCVGVNTVNTITFKGGSEQFAEAVLDGSKKFAEELLPGNAKSIIDRGNLEDRFAEFAKVAGLMEEERRLDLFF
jgi:hypothetical protein